VRANVRSEETLNREEANKTPSPMQGMTMCSRNS